MFVFCFCFFKNRGKSKGSSILPISSKKRDNPKYNFDPTRTGRKSQNCLPVRPVRDDGAAVGSGAVGVVVGYVGREQGRIQELLQGSRAPFLPTLMAD